MSMLDKIKRTISKKKENVVNVSEKIKNIKKTEEEEILEKIENNLSPVLVLSNIIINIFKITKYLKITKEEEKIIITKIKNIFFNEIKKDSLIYNELIIEEDNKLKFRRDLAILIMNIILKIENVEEINYNEIKKFFEKVGKDLSYDQAKDVAENIINKLKKIDFEDKELQKKLSIKSIIKSLEKDKKSTKNMLYILKKVISDKYKNDMVDVSILTGLINAITNGNDLNQIKINILGHFRESFENLINKLEIAISLLIQLQKQNLIKLDMEKISKINEIFEKIRNEYITNIDAAVEELNDKLIGLDKLGKILNEEEVKL